MKHLTLVKKILTERASKDVVTMQSGRAVFKDFGIDETKDRQGNISKLANKQGTIWVEAGDVVSLPSGSKVCVDDASHVNEGDTLSETTIKAVIMVVKLDMVLILLLKKLKLVLER